jgi:hypothetical protein
LFSTTVKMQKSLHFSVISMTSKIFISLFCIDRCSSGVVFKHNFRLELDHDLPAVDRFGSGYQHRYMIHRHFHNSMNFLRRHRLPFVNFYKQCQLFAISKHCFLQFLNVVFAVLQFLNNVVVPKKLFWQFRFWNCANCTQIILVFNVFELRSNFD